MKKAKAIKEKRKTFAERLWDAEQKGLKRGHDGAWSDARICVEAEFAPNRQHQKNITDLVRMIESWGLMSDDAVIMIAGTDLKHHSHAAVPYRLMKVVGEELKRLGYKP